MALTKEFETQTTVLPDGRLEVRTATLIMEDGIELSKSYHRKVIEVGDDVSGEDVIVQDIASNLHTQERINARAATRALEKGNG